MTKIHAVIDPKGRPLRFLLSGCAARHHPGHSQQDQSPQAVSYNKRAYRHRNKIERMFCRHHASADRKSNREAVGENGPANSRAAAGAVLHD